MSISQNQLSLNVERPILAGVTINEEIFILNSPEEWICFLEIQQEMTKVDRLNDKTDPDKVSSDDLQSLLVQQLKFHPNATLPERAVLRARADRLKQSTEGKSVEELTPLTIIALGNQIFGFDLKVIKEFLEVRQIIPIPCCPSHFVGNVNLRGEILTLVDINGLLNLPLKKFVSPSKVMIVEIDNITVGIVVDEIRDAVFLVNPRELTKVLDAIDLIPLDYLQGSVPYQGRSIYILDLPTIFAKGLVAQ